MIFAMATRRRSTKSLLHLNRSLVSLIAALLIFTLQLSLCHAQSQPRLTRRPITKTSIEGSSERSVAPDQLAQAASRSDGQGRNYQRRGSVVHSRTKEPSQDYTYGQLELNLIRPEHETSSLPPHGKINAYYGSSTTQSNNVPHEEAHHDKALDESETAAEYVVNAMKMAYGTRHKDAQQPQLRVVAATQRPYHPSSSTEQQQQHQQQQQQQLQKRQPQQQQYHEPQHQQQQQQHQQQQHQQLQHQQQHQQPQQQHHQQQQQQHLEQEAHKQAKAQAQAALLEAQMQAELQAQLVEQQALLLVEQQRQQQLQQQQQQQQPHGIESAASEASPPAPAPVYEKESGPRSYEIYETPAQPDTEPGAAVAAAPAGAAGAAGGDIERLYRTKYYSYPAPQPYRNLEAEAEEKVRVSASTEIPKAEIMKQIEKSVIKYMKELEAEGKIITTPQELAPPATKTYYKLLSLPNSSRDVASSVGEEKRYSSNGGSNSGGISGSGSTVRPKYSSSSSNGRQPIAHISSQQHTQYHQQQQQSQLKPIAHALTKPQRYQAETETAYQAPELSAEALAPNVEFIYKIKTRAPLQTATVKTVSKPYTLPLKSSAEHFDHGAAMKNIEEFDLSHVVTTPERELEQERVTSKPQKLYFNSEIYHDINSLPYKGEKLRGSHLQHAAQEYRHKLKSSGELHPDYKGYSGYFAEPASSMELAEKQPVSALEGEESEEMGYPIPYQYVLKKEPLSSKYEEERESWESLRLAHGKPNSGGYKSSAAAAAGGSSGSSSLDYDSYSPKFNNNPEGYGYQHTYKTRGVGSPGGAQSSGSNGIKRGKRGGGAHPQAGKKLLRGGGNSGGGGGGGGGATIVGGGKHMKDLEANLALRPPPKN